MMEQQQPPPLPPSLPPSSSSNNIAATETAAAVVKSSTDEIAAAVISSPPPPIFHVLLLPGGNIQKQGTDEATNNKPNVIIDDYLYQRHVYRKQAAARLLRPAAAGVAAKLNEETHTKKNNATIDGEISLNLLASPLEVALISCCVRPPTDDQNNNNKEQQHSSSATQRSRLHRPILPSNADEESDATSSIAQQQPLDTPRTISMKDPTADIHTSNNANHSSNEVGTLQKGQEAHFLKLLQMYCPQCKEGLMYRSLVVEILQRTADWENGVLHLSTRGGSGGNDGSRLISGGATAADTVNVASSGKKVGIGQVGYTFRKQFHSGWYIGKVTAIIPRGSNYTTTTTAASTATTVKDRRCVYNDGDEEDLSLEELKHFAELEELDRYNPDNDDDNNNDDDEQKKKKKEGVDDGCVTNSPDGSGDVTKSEEGGRTESSTEAPEVIATPPSPPPTVNRAKSKHTVMKTFLAVGGMKLLARWLVEAYTVVQPPPSNQPNKRKSSFTLKTEAAAVVSPSSTGALLLPLLTLLKSIPFDKDIIVASSIHKHIKRYKKALDKLSKGMDAQSLNEVVHPIAGGGSVGKAMRGVEEVMTSWNNATAALNAAATTTTSQQDDDDEINSDEKQKQLDPYKALRDQLQSRFDELAAFHNNRTNPPEWVPKHVLGVVMASPKAAPASPTASSKPTLNNNTSSSSMKSNHHPPTKTNNNEWGTNRASAAQLARERFLEGFRKQKDAVSSTTTPGLVPGTNKWTGSPPEKMQKVAHGNDRSSSSSSKRVCWVDKPVGRNGVSPQPLVTERVFVKEEEYVEEDEEVNVHMMFGGDDGNGDEDVPMQEDGAGTYQGDGDAVMEEEGVKDDDQEDSDLDDMF